MPKIKSFASIHKNKSIDKNIFNITNDDYIISVYHIDDYITFLLYFNGDYKSGYKFVSELPNNDISNIDISDDGKNILFNSFNLNISELIESINNSDNAMNNK